MSGRTGRRAGAPDTRAEILGAARRLFAARGLRGTTVRAVAEAAGCDAALVHHYFGTKQDLFLAAADLPVDPEIVRSRIRDVPFPDLGATLTLAVLTVWDSEDGAALLARVRTSVTADLGDELGDLLLSAAMPLLTERTADALGVDRETAERRVTLGMTALIGVVMARHVLHLPPIRDAAIEDLAAAIGPTVQRHLEGRPD